MLRDALETLQDFLKALHKEPNVVVMPDFFIDRIVTPALSLDSFCRKLGEVAQRKGGSIDNMLQTDLRGGNAVNTASALAALGANVTPIVCTDEIGCRVLRQCLRRPNVNLSHVKTLKKPSVTTALEFASKAGKVNVMLRDLGSLADFGEQSLADRDFEAIEQADYTCVFNWAGTRKRGTALAKAIFSRVKLRGKGKTYYDTADPTPNWNEVPEMVKEVLLGDSLDILSVNENEAHCYASLVRRKAKESAKLPLDRSAEESARALSTRLHTRVDLHTTSFAATFTKNGETLVPTFDVPVSRATGAGDAWNAGNIVGDACGLTDECRLALANAVAAYYISSPEGEHPTPKRLEAFIGKLARRRRCGVAQAF